jgi:ABC-2 type transport system ATP-binding protein
MAEEFAIQIEAVVKEFHSEGRRVRAINQLSLNVPARQTFGLIGPDGAGKTTLTRLILGLLKPDQGSCQVLGCHTLRQPYPIREQTGYITQQFVLPPDLTVLENLAFFAEVHALPAPLKKQRIAELLAFTGLEAFTQRLAGRLSGGMKKKLALACSLIHNPQVLLLDEPTLGVDPVSRREFWNLLGNLQAEKGTTIFVCTPYMDEAERCHQVGLIFEGNLISCSSPQHIKASLPGDLLELAPHPFERAAEILSGCPGVLEVQNYGSLLHVFVDQAEKREKALLAALAQAGVACPSCRKMEVRMEEVFISLIRQQRAKQKIAGTPV